MKRGQLSKEEKLYILSNTEKDLKTLAVELDRSEKVIVSFIEETLKQEKAKEASTPAPVEEDGPKMAVFQDLIGKRSNATVLTKAASELGDSFTKKNSNSRFNSRSIYKIKNDK